MVCITIGALPFSGNLMVAIFEQPPPPRARRRRRRRRRSDDLPPPPHANDRVGAPLGAKGWADEPGFHWWKDKEAEILSDIEPIIAREP
ncbi:hypothetical protein ACMD2_22091 [Ananas comosus]|uniref:Uncharacterized protein n=1 Tax=Ananas comosus TaxID=4615 RepID=A0A199VXV3_ANACO|nr:hypothetical protein ACMD2_22091 [Ananas comosus]